MLHRIMRNLNNCSQNLTRLSKSIRTIIDKDLQSLEGLSKYFIVLSIVDLRYYADNLELVAVDTFAGFDE